MRHRLLAILFTLALFAIAAAPARAIQDSERPLPFGSDFCRMLIERGAPFMIGDPDINECFVRTGPPSTR